MRNSILVAIGVVSTAIVIGCGGSSSSGGDSLTSTTATTATTATTSGSGTTGTTVTAVTVGNYSGTFTGSQTTGVNYAGTGTAAISATGAVSLTYSAMTSGSSVYAEDRSFTGTIDSKGNFSGYTPQAPYGGGAVQNLPATGTITENSSTQITVAITWAYPYSNGGTYYTSTENWVLTLQ